MANRSKWGNRKVTNIVGTFDSKKEGDRALVLYLLEKGGAIRNLQFQVRYELIPKQYADEIVQLKTKTKVVRRLIEDDCCYYADFVYEKPSDDGTWVTVVEDVKGSSQTMTPEFRIKKKLMLWTQGIRIRIVTHSSEGI